MKTNVLWGSTVKDTVMIRPWSEQITENSSELVTVTEQNEDDRYEEGWIRKSAFILNARLTLNHEKQNKNTTQMFYLSSTFSGIL